MRRPALSAIVLLSAVFGVATAQAQSVPPQQLTEVIVKLDEAMFAAFNRRDLDGVMALFDPTIEFFHDREGLQTYAQLRKGFAALFANPAAPRRELVAGSVRVFPIPNYGALMVAQHRFCHDENGKPVCGVFGFSHVWQQQNGRWRVTRALSYDH